MCQENPGVIRMGQKYRKIDKNIEVSFIVASKIQSQYKRSLRAKLHQVVSLSVRPSVGMYQRSYPWI